MNETCLEILTFSLLMAPQTLSMHANQWEADRNVVRQRASEVADAMGVLEEHDEAALFSTPQVEEERPTNPKSPYQEPMPGEDRDDTIIRLLSTLKPNVRQSGQLPPHIWPQLNRLLPKHGLQPFLQRHPKL